MSRSFNIKNHLESYLGELNKCYQRAEATEVTYRSVLLENLLKPTAPNNIIITHEPKRSEFGAPDFMLRRDGNVVSFIEAKPIGDNDLKGERKRNGHKEQFDRYKSAISTIVFTDHLTFHLYYYNKHIESATIGKLKEGQIILTSDEKEIAKFETILQSVYDAKLQSITSSSRLAEIMASKARLIKGIVKEALDTPEEKKTREDKDLMKKMKAMKEILMHDMDEDDFADFYSQTIIYGLFIARIHDKTPETFSAHEASTLIPTYSPFLKKIFSYITLTDLHPEVSWAVDDLIEIFRVTKMDRVMKNYGISTGRKDPIVNFYEDFFKQFAPDKRKKSGAWFTPLPIVRYIVDAVDTILKTKFDIDKGIADNSIREGEKDNTKFHRVQILDPATGTGTFLVEVCERIKSTYAGQKGLWKGDVVNHIIPRINGFEYLVAPYTMAHLKLSSVLGLDTISDIPERLNIFLTNSLDESSIKKPIPFAEYISDEINAAASVKTDTPVMVVIGNPPYNEKSANTGEWIMNFMDDYKQEPGLMRVLMGRKRNGKPIYKNTLNERNPKGINNDYCKFIRLGQSFVQRNEEGVLAYINGNTYLDTPIFRGMRYNLLSTFDEIYIINLHGSTKRKEEGDESVFDIEVGVCINIFIRKKNHRDGALARVFYKDLTGTKKDKFAALEKYDFQTTDFSEIVPVAPLYLLRPLELTLEDEYKSGFKIDELMPKGSPGFTTGKDEISVQYSASRMLDIAKTINEIIIDSDSILEKFKFSPNSGRKINTIKSNLIKQNRTNTPIKICYRPFDFRYTIYDDNFIDRPRTLLKDNVAEKENLVLCVVKQGNLVGDAEWNQVFITDVPPEKNLLYRGGKDSFPLYIYEGAFRFTNFSQKIIEKIEERLGLKMQDNLNQECAQGEFLPCNLIDYIYAILHSKEYRRRYHDFLQTDFPVIPYPENAGEFFRLAAVGERLRNLHLMKSVSDKDIFTEYDIESTKNNLVEFCRYDSDTNCLYINEDQYFGNVPAEVYSFNICGYQVVDKWLKDRKGRNLTNDEIIHLQKIIYAISETIKLQDSI